MRTAEVERKAVDARVADLRSEFKRRDRIVPAVLPAIGNGRSCRERVHSFFQLFVGFRAELSRLGA